MSREERGRKSKSVIAESGPGALASQGPRNLSQKGAWVTSPPSCFLLPSFSPHRPRSTDHPAGGGLLLVQEKLWNSQKPKVGRRRSLCINIYMVRPAGLELGCQFTP